MRCAFGIAAAAGLLLASAAPVLAGRRAAILTIVIDEVVAGDRIVYLDDHDALVPIDVFAHGAIRDWRGRIERIDGIAYVALGSIPRLFAIDEARSTIRITTPVADLPASRIDLGIQRPEGLVYRDGRSLYVNYGARSFNTRVDGFIESGLRIDRVLAYSNLAYQPDHGFVRGTSHLALDDRATLHRLVAGDQIVAAGSLGGGGIIGGLHLIRSFDLDPYLITAPSLDLSANVLAPSTADVYVNGVLVRRIQLLPGRITLANLPITTGAGDTRVVIRDALGRQQELASGYYQPSRLLRPGLADYHVAAGAIREQLGVSSFDYGRAVAIARYQRGLTKRLTAGVRAEATTEQRGIGGTLIASSRLGQLDAAAGVSEDRGERGAAGSLAWSYAARRGGVSLYGRRVSARYATVDVGADADRATTEARLNASLAIGRGAGINAQLGALAFRDAGWSTRASLGLTTVPVRHLAFVMTVGRNEVWGESPSYDVMAHLSARLGRRTTGSISHQHRGGDRSTVMLDRSLGNQTGVGYRAIAQTGDVDRAAGSIQGQTTFGRYDVGYTHANGDETVEVGAAGGLAWIGGRLFASRPIDRSFALVRVPGVKGVEASLENHPIGRTDGRGDVFIPNLLPNYGNNISIDPNDLPFGRLLPPTRQVVASPIGGGVVITFDAPVLRVVRGRLRVKAGAVMKIPAYGELSAAGKVSPIGSDGEFELDGLAAGRYAASIEWEGGRCSFELVMSGRRPVIEDVGLLTCEAR